MKVIYASAYGQLAKNKRVSLVLAITNSQKNLHQSSLNV